MSTREWIDRQTTSSPRMKKEGRAKARPKSRFMSLVAASGTPRAASGRAAMVERQIARLLKKA
jgi:hypothetical protein